MFKVASWNVNSINARVEHVLLWLEQNDIDVLALQELKCVDEQFPFDPFFERGYELIVSGQKSYNGVAFIARSEGEDVITEMPQFDDPQKRVLAATFNGIRLINVYVPNGQALGNNKYDYKLDWLDHFNRFVANQLEQYPLLAIMGDFNIAPENADVYDIKEWSDCVLVSKHERAALNKLMSLGLYDSFRLFKQPVDCFSWWDYRSASFRQNKGLRIDLILLSEALSSKCQNSAIDTSPRSWERPSDHAPVLVSLV